MRRRWSEPRDTRAAIAAPWVAVEGFGTMDLKVTAFDAVLYEGASRGIPTTKLHSMYSRMLAAGAAVGAGHSNLQQPGQPCIIPQHGNMRKTFFYRCASVDTPNKLWPNHRADCNM